MSFSLFKCKKAHIFIIICLSFAAFIHNILMNGANNVVISSLQKEFYITSKETGMYVSVYDIGSLISSIFVPILSSRGSRPKWVAFGMVMLFTGCMINILPHFLRSRTSIYITTESKSNITNNEVLMMNNDENNLVEMCNFSFNYNDLSQKKVFRTNDVDKPIENNINAKKDGGFFKFFALKHLLYLANGINGLSSASLTSLAFSYIEDIAPTHKLSAIYESVYFATGALGVGVGFLITSKFLTIYTDVDSIDTLPAWLVPSHPNWIGAWWFPYLIFGIVSLLVALLICTFPKKIKNHDETKESELVHLKDNKEINNDNRRVSNHEDKLNSDDHAHIGNGSLHPNYSEHNIILKSLEQTGSILSINKIGHYPKENEKKSDHDFKSIVNRSLIILKNPIYIFIIMTTALEGLLQNSFLAFAALFMEYQYRITSGGASFLLGMLSIPPLIVGGLLSGLIASRLKGNQVKCIKFLCVGIFVNTIIYLGFLFYCKEPNMITTSLNTDHCNTVAADCNCDSKIFKPVCLLDSNDISFQSSCLAGCSNFDNNNKTYTNCSQDNCYDFYQPSVIETYFQNETNNHNLIQRGSFINGLCPNNSCKKDLILASIAIFLLMFMNALMFVPYLKVAISCSPSKEMNTIVLGIKQLFMNAFGTIPGPIIFGAVIDLTCSYWHTDSNNRRVCKIYNNRLFSISFALLGVGFKFICLLLMLLSLFCSMRNERKNSQKDVEKKDTGVVH